MLSEGDGRSQAKKLDADNWDGASIQRHPARRRAGVRCSESANTEVMLGFGGSVSDFYRIFRIGLPDRHIGVFRRIGRFLHRRRQRLGRAANSSFFHNRILQSRESSGQPRTASRPVKLQRPGKGRRVQSLPTMDEAAGTRFINHLQILKSGVGQGESGKPSRSQPRDTE
jgi:hypothetical protein